QPLHLDAEADEARQLAGEGGLVGAPGVFPRPLVENHHGAQDGELRLGVVDDLEAPGGVGGDVVPGRDGARGLVPGGGDGGVGGGEDHEDILRPGVAPLGGGPGEVPFEDAPWAGGAVQQQGQVAGEGDALVEGADQGEAVLLHEVVQGRQVGLVGVGGDV